ncbi:uncharacterized protein LOC110418502 [Herrania umbratica]|uniref:Uncharacterized protein LOC110418502 n=1 Tax=Herrania umbratica TaxID=108875 RepID=A0A6J1AJA7_9ROSI|nr:uncharacterized protein LOC110418502 [Herrania umbratica]
MKVKKKGAVYPPLSSPSSPVCYRDPNSVLKLLPVAILTLALPLPPQDQEVLAYMITRSIISTTNPSTFNHQSKNKCKKGKAPLFQCGCFDCYTRFWHRWDSSPNRDLIHQVIEAFEDHLLQNEVSKKHNKAARKKDKEIYESNVVSVNALHREQSQDSEISMVENEALAEAENGGGRGGPEHEGEGNVDDEVTGNLEMEVVTVATGASHKGLARKVLPDVVGLFNSRLWSLWGPSI